MANPKLVADIIGGIKTDKNYIRGQVEKNTAGWATYKDAAQSFPEDGTGGSPTVTWTLTTSSPLRDSASFLFTQPASNTQGEGASYDFSIDRADRYSVLRISFEYEVASGTFDYGDGTVADPSDLRVFIYDVTNALLTETTQTLLDGSGKFLSEFQASDSQSYRLILHKATTTATAFTFKADNFSVGPREIARGPLVTDWVSYTPSFIGTSNGVAWTNSTVSGKWRRDGDSIELQLLAEFSGLPAGGTGSFEFELPSGLSIDTSKITSASSARTVVGSSQLYDTSTVFQEGSALYNSANSGGVTAWVHGASNQVGPTIPVTIASGDKLAIMAKVPVSGWASNTVTSSDSGTRVVAAKSYNNAGTAVINSSDRFMDFPTAVFDKTASVAGAGSGFQTVYTSGWRYIFPESGIYDIDLYYAQQASSTASTRTRVYACINGAEVASLIEDTNPDVTSGNEYTYSGATSLEVTAGQALSIALFKAGATMALSASGAARCPRISISKRQNPQTIALADSVAASYTSNSGQSIPNNAVTIVDFEDKDYDTFNAVTTGASWKFTAPMAGVYSFKVAVTFDSATGWDIGEIEELLLYKNGSLVRELDLNEMLTSDSSASATFQKGLRGSADLKLVAGDYIDIRTYQTSGTAKTLYANTNNNFISIARLP